MTASSSSPTRSDSAEVGLQGDEELSCSEPHEVQVHFSTNLPEIFQLPDHPFVVPSAFSRLDLSRLVNQLLQQQNEEEWMGYQPFDFLVDSQWFLRTSLQKYMDDRGITAEVPLNLHYQLAVRHLEEEHLPPTCDWISSLTSIPSEGMLLETSYDGRCRLYRVSRALSSSKSHSQPVLEVALHQGPLTAGVAFAAGAFLPPHCIQLVAGSKGGALSVLNAWSSSAKSPWKEESRATGGPEASSGGFWHAELHCLGCQGSSVTCVGLSTDGVTIASGGADGTVMLWENFGTLTEAANRAEERSREEQDLGGTQGRAKRKRCPQGQGGDSTQGTQYLEPKLRLTSSHTEAVTDVVYAPSPFRCVLYSGSLDGTVSAWDTLVGGDPLSTWPTPRAITSLTCSPTNGRIVCTAHEDGRLRLWDVRSGNGEASSLAEPMKSGSVSKNAASTLDSNTRLDLQFAFGFPHRRLATQVRWSPRGAKGDSASEHLLSSVGQDGVLRVLDVRAPTTPLLALDVRSGEEKIPVRLLTCAWCDSSRIATGGSDGMTRIHTIGSRWTGE